MNLIYSRWLMVLTTTVVLVALTILPAAGQNEINPDDGIKMDAIEEAVTTLRGLAPLEPIVREVMARGELEAWLVEQMSSEFDPDDLYFYYAFDFVSLDTDLWQLVLDLLTEQIGGFYDDAARRMVVVADAFDPTAELIYAHEYTHALQDQHFSLAQLGVGAESETDDPDLLLARLALVEGDAQQATQDYLMWRVQDSGDTVFALGLFGGLAGTSMAQFDAAPPILRAELLFPYLDGQRFIQAALTRGGWALVDAMYERPPLSTEQVLHPDRYFGADEPQLVEVVLPDAALGPNWRQTDQATLGEFYLREYLAQRLPTADAERAAEGWGGDRFAVYYSEATQGILFVYRAVWDSASDGREFAEAYAAFAEARYDGESILNEDNLTCWDGPASAPHRASEDSGDPALLRTDSTCLYAQGSNTLIIQGPDLNTVMAVYALQPTPQ